MSNLQTSHEQYQQSIIIDQAARISRLEAEVADNYSLAADRITELMAEVMALKEENAKLRFRVKETDNPPDAMQAGENP